MRVTIKSCQKLSIMIVIMCAIFLTGCEEVIIGTNLEKGDKYYAKGDYQNAYACYMAAAQDYQAKIGKIYVSTADAKADAMKMVEAYYKSGLTCEQLAKDAEARQNFENAMQDAINVKQSYNEKVPTNIPDTYVTQWVPAEYKDVWVDGHYKSVWKDSGYEDVWVEGTYKNVWVEPTTKKVWVEPTTKKVWVDGSYEEVYNDRTGRYDSVWKDGYYKNQHVEGYYKTETVAGYYQKKYVDGHYEKKKVDGGFEKVWVEGRYEREEVTPGDFKKILVPAHVEIVTVTKQKDVSITLDKTYYDLADKKLNKSSNIADDKAADINVNTTANATAIDTNDVDAELKIAQEEMQTAYRLYLKTGTNTPYIAAQKKYQQLLAAKKK